VAQCTNVPVGSYSDRLLPVMLFVGFYIKQFNPSIKLLFANKELACYGIPKPFNWGDLVRFKAKGLDKPTLKRYSPSKVRFESFSLADV